jgi:hypothetical protein
MAEKAIVDARNIGVTYLRVSATGYYPDAYSRAGTGNSGEGTGDLELWRDDPSAYWGLFDQMMDDLHSNGVRIVPVFVWNWTQFPAMTGETADRMIDDPNSESYQLLERYIAEFVDRYQDHPALYFYELTNELNLEADLDEVERCLGNESLPPAVCEPISNFSTDQMIAFTSRLAGYVRGLDPYHPISSGFSMPRPFAEHLRMKPEYSTDGPDWTLDTLEEFKKNLSDIHSEMDIVSVHFSNKEGNNERFGISGHANADLLDIVKQTTDEIGKELFVGEFVDVDPWVKDDKDALFTQNVLDKIVELEIPYSAPWVWEFYDRTPYTTYDNPATLGNLEPGYTDLIISNIKEANEELGNHMPPAPLPDTTPPQVVVTWPLEGWLSCDQLVHAVASDDSGTVSEVEFFVDGNLETTVSTPPYQFSLDAARLGFSKHQITAIAHDPSGNVGESSVSGRPQICIRQRLSQVLGF